MRSDDMSVAILEAAGRLLNDEGPTALTVRRIASAAGGSTMNVYSRFGGKDGVVEALFREGFRTLHQMMEPSIAIEDPLEALHECGEAYRRFALAHRPFYAVMFGGAVPRFEPSAEAAEESLATLGVLASLVERAMAAGVLAAGDPMSVAVALWATNHGLVSLEMQGHCPVDPSSVHRATLDALVRGLLP
ncbi:MAG: TetR/AcrR family transcriptional regulator [Ilumatobacteraceae bacterium]